MDTQESRAIEGESKQEMKEEVTAENDLDRERNKIQKLLDEKKIGAAQNNVALQDLKAGKKFEFLPYLFVNRELALDVVQEASNWYDGQRSEFFQMAIFLLKCDNITKAKMEAARKYFDSLPPKRELAKLIGTMGDEDFKKYLDEYKSSSDPVALSRKISNMEGSLEYMKEMLEKMAPAEKKEDKAAAKKTTEHERMEKEAEIADEETERQKHETQNAAIKRIEKMFQNKQINVAQMRLAKFQIMSGTAFENLPYLAPKSYLKVSMIDDVVDCIDAGMDQDVLSALLQQPSITSSRLRILLDFIPNLPDKDELIIYLRDAESDEALKNVLTEYKNRNDIDWVRGQLKERETTLHDKEKALKEMETRLKAAEDEVRTLKGESETGDPGEENDAEKHESNPNDKDDLKSDETSGSEDKNNQEVEQKQDGNEDGSAESSEAEDEDNEKDNAEQEETDEEEKEALIKEDPAGEEETEDSIKKAKVPSFFERILPGFYHAERKEYVENRWKDKEKKKKDRELRAELERTVNDMYAQNVIDDEAFYIFADIAFKGQKMDKRAATFMVQELHNGVPFSLLCKVVQYVKNSGDWSSCAMVLRELLHYEKKMNGNEEDTQMAMAGT